MGGRGSVRASAVICGRGDEVIAPYVGMVVYRKKIMLTYEGRRMEFFWRGVERERYAVERAVIGGRMISAPTMRHDRWCRGGYYPPVMARQCGRGSRCISPPTWG